MKNLNLKGKKIRLFFHTDLDGAVSASLIKLFSGADVVKFVACPYQNYSKPESMPGVLDVFVDCRSRNRDEDIRIDHHASGEEPEYLKKEGIIVDTHFDSAVSLVAKYLGINVDSQILSEMDKVDSGKANIFSKFTMDDNTLHKIMFTPGFHADDYKDYEVFKDKLLSYMVKGFAIEDIKDTSKYERSLETKYKVIIEDIKKPNKSLIKIVHTPTHESFLKHVFKMTDDDFFSHILPYVQQHYYEESKKSNIGIYVVIGFEAHNYEFDDQLRKIRKDHPEPYQIFVSRSHGHTSVNIGDLIQEVKKETGITNGGGRADVGGMNTADKNAAIKALNLLVAHIRKNAP